MLGWRLSRCKFLGRTSSSFGVMAPVSSLRCGVPMLGLCPHTRAVPSPTLSDCGEPSPWVLMGAGPRLLSAPRDHSSHPLGEVFSDSLGVSPPRPQGWQHQPAEALWWPGQGLQGRNAGLGARGQQTPPGLCPGNRSCAALGSAGLSEAPSHGLGQRLSGRLGQVRANVQAGCTPWALAPSVPGRRVPPLPAPGWPPGARPTLHTGGGGISSVQLSCCHVRLFATPWTTACQASPSIRE